MLGSDLLPVLRAALFGFSFLFRWCQERSPPPALAGEEGLVQLKLTGCALSALGEDNGGPPVSAFSGVFEIATLTALEQGLSFWVHGQLA